MEPCQQKANFPQPVDVEISPSFNPKLGQVESQLQNLGFVINNGEARFKLDENTSVSANPGGTMDFSMIDTNDTLSFVVLSRTSLDSIQASSLASYVDIQQKSKSVDYNSLVSSMSSSDIHQKLTELLQENSKLKETLKQNNNAMKQQIGALATWQEEMMKVHQNHKKKFAETTELIKYLKKENTELKMRLSMEHSDIPETGYNIVDTTDIKERLEQEKQSIPVMELQEKVSSLTNELNNSKLQCEKLSSDVEKLLSISNLMSSQLKQTSSVMQEQRLNMQKSESASLQSQLNELSNTPISEQLEKNPKNFVLCESCSNKDGEINDLKESITLLEQKLQDAITPIQFCIKNPLNVRQYHQQCAQNMKEYVERLQEVTNSFDMQLHRITNIAKYLGKIINIVEQLLCKLSTKPGESDYYCLLDRMVLQTYKDKLSRYRIRILEEQKKLNSDKQKAIKTQNQFLLDYESTLHELEIMIEENSKITTTANTVTENKQQAVETQKQKTDDKLLLEQERKILVKERESLQEEKRVINSQRKNLDAEYKSLNEAKELLKQERISLDEEKTSLDQQSQLYENFEKALQIEKKAFEIKCNKLADEIKTLGADLQKRDLEVKELQKQIKQYEETINILQIQLGVYQEDFKQERKIKQTLLEDHNKAIADLQKQMEFNTQLQDEISRLNGQKTIVGSREHGSREKSDEATAPPPVTTFTCPNCDCMFRNPDALSKHVESCLNLF